MKVAKLRPKARQDLRHELAYCRGEGSKRVAQQLRAEAEKSLGLLMQNPGLGSPTLGNALEMEILRTWRLSGFPLLWLYIEHPGYLDVVRLLGQRQEVAAIFGDEF
jgi:toxin ParE1/3/4